MQTGAGRAGENQVNPLVSLKTATLLLGNYAKQFADCENAGNSLILLSVIDW